MSLFIRHIKIGGADARSRMVVPSSLRSLLPCALVVRFAWVFERALRANVQHAGIRTLQVQ